MNTGIHTGAITGYIDVAQIVLYVFWIFFAGLIVYLHKENKREGYPLESDRSGGRIKVQGFPAVPRPKTYLLRDGTTLSVPRAETDTRPVLGEALGGFPGAPLQPTGNPMLDNIGPASWSLRSTHPDMSIDGRPMLVPLRVDATFWVSGKDPDPRGMTVYGADKVAGGVVTDLWVDRAEPQIRYYEVETTGGRHVLLPYGFAKVSKTRGSVKVRSILGSQFAAVPALSNPDQVSLREEDQIQAYYAGGTLYATPARAEPLL